jgi:hypothetical protein
VPRAPLAKGISLESVRFVSFHHYRRLTEHSDLSNLEGLTALQALIATTLAIRQNDNPAKPFRASARYLADVTGRSENAINKACQSLVDVGLFSSESSNRRRGNIYLLLLDCPEDCHNRKSHYSRAELALIKITNGSGQTTPVSAVMDDVDPLNDEKGLTDNTPEYPSARGTNRTYTTDTTDKTFVSPLTRGQQPLYSPFTYGQLSEYLDGLTTFPDRDQETVLDALATDGRPYDIALGIIRDVHSQRPISDPLAYIGRIFTDKPLRLLAGAPGTKPRNPIFKKPAGEESWAAESYEQAISHLCEDLGIDYEAEFAVSARDRQLRELHLLRALTLDAVRESYNSVREPKDWLELTSNPY